MLTVYLIIFWLLALAALLMQLKLTRTAKLSLIALSYVLLVLFVGLRWEVGNDWAQYYDYYRHISSLRDRYDVFLMGQGYGVGYRLISVWIKNTGLPFAGFNLMYAAIYLGLIFLSFKHDNFKISGWLILQLYAPFILGLMGTMRQVMAIAICMFSIRYLLSKDWRRFLLCVCFATAFHISALVFLFAWPLARIRLTFRRMSILVVVVFLALVLDVGSLATKYGVLYASAFNNADLDQKLLLEQAATSEQFEFAAGSRVTVLWTVSQLALLLLFIACFRLFSEEADRLYFKLYLTGVVLLLLLSGPMLVLAERASLYFTLFQMHLIALPTRRIKRSLLRQLYCAALIAVCLARLCTGLYLQHPRYFLPYKGVFINQDVRRDAGWFWR
jgi:hypothetical protein